MPLTRTEQRMIFTALAFITVAQQQQDVQSEAAVKRIEKLAELIEMFCVEIVLKPAAQKLQAQEDQAYTGKMPQRRAEDWRLCENQRSLLRDAEHLLDGILHNGFNFTAEQEAELLLSLVRDRQTHLDRLAV